MSNTGGAQKVGRGALVKEEEDKKIIQFRHVTNDGKRDSMILLTGLKNIYQKQLPKMPREYIARLVYDRLVPIPFHSSVLCGINNNMTNYYCEIVKLCELESMTVWQL
jgi:hypothetical protein